jgi:hypothetical protein
MARVLRWGYERGTRERKEEGREEATGKGVGGG